MAQPTATQGPAFAQEGGPRKIFQSNSTLLLNQLK